jgi:hypothetical protein
VKKLAVTLFALLVVGTGCSAQDAATVERPAVESSVLSPRRTNPPAPAYNPSSGYDDSYDEIDDSGSYDSDTSSDETDETDDYGTLSNDDYYTNVDGDLVHSPAYSSTGAAPAGATAQCADGTYSFSQHRSGTCSYHGGVSSWR